MNVLNIEKIFELIFYNFEILSVLICASLYAVWNMSEITNFSRIIIYLYIYPAYTEVTEKWEDEWSYKGPTAAYGGES